MKLLLAEDSRRLQELLSEGIRGAGYRLDVVGSASELEFHAMAYAYDLAIVDLGLPDGDGLHTIRKLRAEKFVAPILIITARDTVDERVLGLDSGADDYLIKPFNHSELLARIRALLRRPTNVTGPVLVAGPMELDERSGIVTVNGRSVEIRASERRVLSMLMRRPGQAVAKSVIEAALSEAGREISSNAVEVLISRIRKTIGEVGTGASIDTVRGFGYVLRLTGGDQ